MKSPKIPLNCIEELEEVFSQFDSSPDIGKDAYQKSRYGTYQNLSDMPVYSLLFEPYKTLANECGCESISFKRSVTTGRFYAWNVNLGGHGPKLELRPVKVEHVKDVKLMKKYYQNWAYELGLHIDLNAKYEI